MPPPLVESVVPTRERPEPIVSVFTGDVPLPMRIPESVVEPVPPLRIPRVPVKRLVPMDVVATIDPFALVERSELVMLVMARLVVVACWSDVFPVTVKAPTLVLEALLIYPEVSV